MMKKLLSNNSVLGLLCILFIPLSVPVFGLLIPYLHKYAIPYMMNYADKCLNGALYVICIYSMKIAIGVSFVTWMTIFVIVLIGVVVGIIESIFG